MGLIAMFGVMIVLAVWLMILTRGIIRDLFEHRREEILEQRDRELPRSAAPCGHDPVIEAELEKVRKAGGFYEYWKQRSNDEFRRQSMSVAKRRGDIG